MQQPTGTKLKKSYEEPALKKLTPEQAKKLLLPHASRGNQEAKKILDLVLPTDNDSK